jgi:hypothetical protein
VDTIRQRVAERKAHFQYRSPKTRAKIIEQMSSDENLTVKSSVADSFAKRNFCLRR